MTRHCPTDTSCELWIIGTREAYESLSQADAFTMPDKEFSKAIMNWKGYADTEASWEDFMRRCDILQACFDRGLSKAQAANVVGSCIAKARHCGEVLLARWRIKAEQVHKACAELLAQHESEKKQQERQTDKVKHRAAKKAAKQDSELESECIICLDARRDFTFQPCGHRVSCAACAAALRLCSDTCPWCRTVLDV